MSWKNPSTSVRFEPANLGSRGEHVTPRSLRPTWNFLIYTIQLSGVTTVTFSHCLFGISLSLHILFIYKKKKKKLWLSWIESENKGFWKCSPKIQVTDVHNLQKTTVTNFLKVNIMYLLYNKEGLLVYVYIIQILITIQIFIPQYKGTFNKYKKCFIICFNPNILTKWAIITGIIASIILSNACTLL